MPKTLFIDSTEDIDKVWKRVHGPKDIPVTVNMGPVDEKDVPARAAGYDTVINDATYFSAPSSRNTVSCCCANSSTKGANSACGL